MDWTTEQPEDEKLTVGDVKEELAGLFQAAETAENSRAIFESRVQEFKDRVAKSTLDMSEADETSLKNRAPLINDVISSSETYETAINEFKDLANWKD